MFGRDLGFKPLAKGLAKSVLLAVIGSAIALYFYQDALIFRARGMPDLTKVALSGVQEIKIPTSDGLELLAWYKPPKQNLPVILYLHGNGGNIGMRAPIARKFLDEGFGVLLLEYRGYGGNDGTPSADGLVLDAKAGYDFLRKELGKNALVSVYGESLGAAVAIQMLDEFPDAGVASLALYAPFTKLSDVVAWVYPNLPLRHLLRHEFDSIGRIANIHVPLLVLHGEGDNFVPAYMGKEIFAMANEPKLLWLHPSANHYALWQSGAIEKAVEFFLKTAGRKIGDRL